MQNSRRRREVFRREGAYLKKRVTKYPEIQCKDRLFKRSQWSWAGVLVYSLGLGHCQVAQKSNLQEFNGKSDPEGGVSLPQPETGLSAGRYQGLARTIGSKRQFHLTVDVAYVGSQSYRIFVRLSPGEEESKEFSSLFFSQGTLDRKKIVFRSTLSKDLWGYLEESGNDQVTGGFYSATGKQLVEFNLAPTLSRKSEKPVVAGLSGFYKAKSCAAHLKGLYLEAFRESRDSPVDQSPLRISGRLVQKDAILCMGKAACVAESYTSGYFDPFSGTVMLDSATQKRTCVLQKNMIACDIPCSFERSQDDSGGVLVNSAPIVPDSDPERAPKSLSVFDNLKKIDVPPSQKPSLSSPYEGQYYGYVYHETLQSFQLFALNLETITTKASQGSTGVQMAPMGSLYFGEGDSSEFIAFSFLPVPVPNGQSSVVFEGRGDGVLVVRRWDQDGLVGDWYSKSFGYVGPVSLSRGIVPKLPQGAKMIQPLSSAYLGGAWNLEITASSEISDYGTAFYPLKIYGYAKEQILHSKRRIIEKGSYHFYSGQILLRLDDHRAIIGQIQSDGMMLYLAPSPRVGTDIEQGKSIVFKKSGIYPEPRALLEKPEDRS